jgi:hypothetical protein
MLNGPTAMGIESPARAVSPDRATGRDSFTIREPFAVADLAGSKGDSVMIDSENGGS